jgi:hemolysin activation/secretion protein
LLFTLPNKKGFYETASFGVDYKHFTQDMTVGDTLTGTPITYWPFTASYNGTWVGKGRLTELNAAVTFSFRGLGSTQVEFDNRRYNADGNFFYIRGNLAHTQDLPGGFQVFGQVQGQGSATPLVDSEEFSLGGLNTVRGYLESTVLGDSAVVGNLEVRSPSLLWWAGTGNEWRLFAFLDGGAAYVNDPLPEQTTQYNLWSFGAGSTIKLFDHLNGAVLVGVPMISQTDSQAGHPFLSFRFWGDL